MLFACKLLSVPVTTNLVQGQKMVLGLFFAAKNGPRAKLALQNLARLFIDWSAYHFMDQHCI